MTTHRTVAEDCWRMIKAMVEGASRDDEHLNDAAAINLIEMAYDSAAEAQRPWQPIETAPKDGAVIIGALIRDGHVWRVHDMRHNGLAFYTLSGHGLPQMTHWLPMPELPANTTYPANL